MNNELKLLEQNLLSKQKEHIIALEDKIKGMEIDILTKETEISKQTTKVNELISKIAGKEKKIEEQKSNIEIKHKQISDLEAKQIQFEKTLRLSEESILVKDKSWSDKYNNLLGELEEERKKYRSKQADADAQKQTIINERDELRNNLKRQLLSCDELKVIHSEKDRESKHLIDNFQLELEKWETKAIDLQKHINELESKLGTAEKDKSAMIQQLTDLNDMLSDIRYESQSHRSKYDKEMMAIKKYKKNLAHEFKMKLKDEETRIKNDIITKFVNDKKEKVLVEKNLAETIKKLKINDKNFKDLQELSAKKIKVLDIKVHEKELANQQLLRLIEKEKREMDGFVESLQADISVHLSNIKDLNDAVEKYHKDNKILIRENKLLINKLLNFKEFNSLKRLNTNAKLEGLDCNYDSIGYDRIKMRSMSPDARLNGHKKNSSNVNLRYLDDSRLNQFSKFKSRDDNTEKFFENDWEATPELYNGFEVAQSSNPVRKIQPSNKILHINASNSQNDNNSPIILEALKKLQYDYKNIKHAYDIKKDEADALAIIINELKAGLSASNESISALKQEASKLQGQLSLADEKDAVILNLKNRISERDQSFKELEEHLKEANDAHRQAKDRSIALQKDIIGFQNEYSNIQIQLERERESFVEKFSAQRAKIRRYENALGEDIDQFLNKNSVLLDHLEQLETEKYSLNERIDKLSAENDKLKSFYEKNQFVQIKKKKPESKQIEEKYMPVYAAPVTKIRNYNIKDDDYH